MMVVVAGQWLMVVVTANWVIIYHLPPIKGTRGNGHLITGASILIPGIVELTREIMGAHPRRTNIAKRPKVQF